RWLVQVVIMIGAVLISHLSTFKYPQSFFRGKSFLPVLLAIVGATYIGTSLMFLSQNILLPITLPTLTWLTTGLVVQLWLLYNTQQHLITQQQHEIAQLKSAESDAVILQTRKLLQRIASGVHDGPLQELRLVMDKLELEPEADLDAVVDKLSGIGKDIRSYLKNIRNMADRLKVTPELRQGLASGVTQHLQQLQDSGKLTLEVFSTLQPLAEPAFNSEWIDAREDIFSFFREAIANVIFHAQPPHGSATQVRVTLSVEGALCTLKIENDGGATTENSMGVLTDYDRRGGYGTKGMETIASSLPDGTWTRRILPNGACHVELTWAQHFSLS
ncbi:MAG: hypothetical protein F6K19_48110, partial [Cyanothece sp. SIO1E1]|nr:hypothetical protein [Cyanothece sp. SIO1E1]